MPGCMRDWHSSHWLVSLIQNMWLDHSLQTPAWGRHFSQQTALVDPSCPSTSQTPTKLLYLDPNVPDLRALLFPLLSISCTFVSLLGPLAHLLGTGSVSFYPCRKMRWGPDATPPQGQHDPSLIEAPISQPFSALGFQFTVQEQVRRKGRVQWGMSFL